MNNKFFFFHGIWLICFFVVLRTLSQIFLKLLALRPGGIYLVSLIFDPLFYLVGTILFAQTVIWLLVLRRLDLSVAYSFTSLSVITLLVSGAFFFGESITLGNVLGGLVIMAGVFVISGAKGGRASHLSGDS